MTVTDEPRSPTASNAERVPASYDELLAILDNLPLLVLEKRRRRQLPLRAAAAEAGLSFTAVYRFEKGEGCKLETALALLRWVAT